MDAIIWEAPPAVTTRQGWRYAAFYRALRSRRGEWARHPGHWNSAVQYAARNPNTWEATSGSVGGKRYGYIRFIGNCHK